MEANSFDEFEILEKENQENDKLLAKSNKDIEVELQEMMEKAGKTDNDLGSGSEKKGGNLFSRLFSKLFSKSPKDTSAIEIELEDIKPEALIDDADGGIGLKEEKKDADKTDAANDTDKADAVDDITGVGNELEKIVQNFDDEDDKKKTGEKQKKNSKKNSKKKSGKKSKEKAARDDRGIELEDLDRRLGEDDEEEEVIPERDEYVYDPKYHWGTTNLLHSFIYRDGEEYNYRNHGRIRNWFHKTLFGSYSSQEKSRRELVKAEKTHKKEEEESGRFYGDDAGYNRWEHNAASNWFHDKWYHMKNAHRKAVDRFYNHEKDYRNMPWYQRAIWCVKNPVARIMVNFPRTHFGMQARANLLDRMRKLYRQAISEGVIPKSKLGDLDYDPLTGAEGNMTHATEQRQRKYEAEALSSKRKTNVDYLKAARANVLKQLMMINDTKDIVVTRCVSQGEDPEAGVREYMKNETVRKAFVSHLNGLRRADWEIAKLEAVENKTEMPDESKDPTKNPIEIAEGDEGVAQLITLVNKELGRTDETGLGSQKLLNKTSQDFMKENKDVERLESYQSNTAYGNYASIGINSMVSYKFGGPALMLTDAALAVESYLDVKHAKEKGDTITARKKAVATAKYAADIWDRGGAMIAAYKGLEGSAAAGYVGPGTIVAGLADVVGGSIGTSHYNDVIKEMEEIKKEQEDKNSRKYKMIDMVHNTAEAERQSSIGQIVGGVVNAVGGILMATGALSTVGLIVSIGSMGINMIGDSLSEGKKKDKAASNVNVEMGLVERQRLLWDYYLKHGGQPGEYSRGITKRAVLMEEGFEKGTRSQAAFQQRISYAQKITDNLNSDNPDPTYEKMIKSLKIEKGEDGMYHMEAVATGLGADSKNIARTFLESTSDNEFIDVAEKMKRRNENIEKSHSRNLTEMATSSGTDIVEKALKDIDEKKRLEAEAEEKRKKEEEEKKKKQEEEAAKKLEEEKKKTEPKEDNKEQNAGPIEQNEENKESVTEPAEQKKEEIVEAVIEGEKKLSDEEQKKIEEEKKKNQKKQ